MVKKKQTIYAKFSYPKKFKHRYRPKVRTSSSGFWKEIDPTNAFKDDNGITTLQLDLEKDTLIIAAQELFTYANTIDWAYAVGQKEYVEISNAGNSVLGKNIPVLDITIGEKKNKDLIVLLTRQHPPEVTGFFAFQAFLETLLNDSELSKIFLEKYRVLAFPIMNPDGVDLGHWRHNANGVDLNRDWLKYNQPEINNVVNYLNRTSKKEKF